MTKEKINASAGKRLSPWAAIANSARELTNLSTVCVLAIMLAACCIFGLLTIPLLGQALQIKFSFLIYALCGTLYGPMPTVLLGICDQLLIETLLKGNGMFFGYIVSFALRGAIYGSFLYYRTLSEKGMTVARLALLKTTDTLLYNVLINTYLNYRYGFISAGSFAAAVSVRIGKNVVLIPLEILLLCVFLSAMLRALPATGFIPRVKCPKITGKQIALITSLAVVGLGLLIAYLTIPAFREVLKFGVR